MQKTHTQSISAQINGTQCINLSDPIELEFCDQSLKEQYLKADC
jgi:hypothetical protein